MGRNIFAFDWITALLLVCLAAFGLFLLLTIQPALFYQQLLFLIVGFFLLIGFSLLDAEVLTWFAPIGYVIGILSLIFSYFGPSIRGATRWVFIGPIQLQPSELAKPFMLLAFAYFISRWSPRNMKYLPMHALLFVIPFLLVLKQPDLGTSMIYASFWLGMMLAGGMSLLVVVGAVGVGALLLPVFWTHLAEYQKNRVRTFLDPAFDPAGAGYNALQAMIAVGSGRLFGRGLGRGTQSHLRFLPEFHTDFIFATLIEEFGFFGGAALLATYALLFWRILSPLFKGVVHHIFPFVYAIGLFTMLLAQVFVNTGMNMGIIPVTGITLPFVSYGGSSILSIAMSFGILAALLRAEAMGRGIAIPASG